LFFTTKGNIGTGIGLWVTRQLVEKRGGQITLTSDTDAESSGTRVVVFLPFGNFPISLADALGIKSELTFSTVQTM
jgi:signal transduction histidine kinase